ncbi:MAG TPA: hypothetical protein VF079_08355 [Sphingomicrobium sp.]
MAPMSAGLALVLLAQAASAAPAQSAPDPAAAAATPASAECKPGQRSTNANEIVICAERSDGYRLNPDVMEARREIRNRSRPTRPGPGGMKDGTCAVGPMGCGPQAGINLLGAALTAAEMAKRLADGKEVGSMFLTDPHPSEYQLYRAAKARREADEAEQAAKARAKAAAEAEAKQP